MVINGERGSEIFIKSFTKGSFRFKYVVLITFYSVTLIPVNHSTFLGDGVSVLEGNQEDLDDIASFEVSVYSQFVTDIFETFTSPIGVGYCHVDVVVLVVYVCFLIVVISDFETVKQPIGKCTPLKSHLVMFLLLLW